MFKNNLFLLKSGYGLHTSCVVTGKSGKVLSKLMGGDRKKKYYVSDKAPVLPSTIGFSRGSIETKITGNPRRSNMLNKLFMRHVTDIMATGEYAKDIVGYGIEVNKVKVSGDYKFLRVYWIAKQSEKHEEIESILKKNAGHLRHELSTLRLMGQVPNIVFVKDKDYCKITDVQERLGKADMGEDYKETDLAEHLRSEFEILTTLDCDVKENLKRLEATEFTQNIIDDLKEIPEMPQNVLGLNHADILKRVKKGMSMSKASHRSQDSQEWTEWSQFKSTQSVNQDPVIYATLQERRQAFKKFLQQRQILKKKEQRLDKNWTADRDYLEEEMRDRYLKSMERDDVREEDDYILEEDLEETRSNNY